MKTEFEAKYYFINKDVFRKNLTQLGAKLIQSEQLYRRTVYCTSKDNTYARVRDEGGKITMSIKKTAQDNDPMDAQGEICLMVNDFDDANAFLQYIQVQQKSYQETLREKWEWENAEIVIDTWPGLEPYVEIETSSEKEVLRIAKELQLDQLQTTFKSVSHLYHIVYGVSEEVVNDKTPIITFQQLPSWIPSHI